MATMNTPGAVHICLNGCHNMAGKGSCAHSALLLLVLPVGSLPGSLIDSSQLENAGFGQS